MSVKVINKAAETQRKLEQAIIGHLNSAAASMETVAQQLAPVLTGNLRGNIKQTKQASHHDLSSQVESGAEYSLYVEYGTVNMDSQPFFTPAFESAKRQLAMIKLN